MELIIEGASLGDSYMIQVEPPRKKVRIGEPSSFSITLIPEEESTTPEVLRWEKGAGVEGPDGKWDGESLKDRGIRFELPLILRGKKGETVLRFILKGEEFRATLALLELSLDTGPQRLGVNVIGWPLRWDGSPPLEIDVEFQNKDDHKVKLEYKCQLMDENDREIGLFEGGRCSFDESKKVKVPIELTDSIVFREIKVKFDMKVDGDHQTLTMEKVILPQKEEMIKVRVPGSVEAGSVFTISIEKPSSEVKDVSIILGTIEPLKADRIERSDRIWEAFFKMPEDLKGMLPLVVTVDGKEAARSPVFIEKHAAGEAIHCTVSPDLASPGDTVDVSVDLGKIDLAKDDRIVLSLNAKDMKGSDLDIRSDQGTWGASFKVPKGIDLGVIGGHINVYREGEVIADREFSRLLTVRSKGGLVLDLIGPFQSIGIDTLDQRRYLIPGERVLSSRTFKDVTLSYTDLGKTIVERKNNDERELLPVDKKDRMIVSRTMVLDTFLDAFSTPEISDRIEEAFRSSLKISSMVSEEDARPAHLADKGFTGNLADRFLKEGKDPALKTSSKAGKDPVSDLALLLKDIMGTDGIGRSANPAGKLGDLIEHIVKGSKGEDKGVNRSLLSFALGEISSRGLKAQKSLASGLGSDVLDEKKTISALRRTCFYLIAHSLVRVEMISRWSEPVVSAWSQLRIERQRAVKTEVQALMDLIDSISDIYNAARNRWEAYERNLEKRKLIEALTYLEINRSPDLFDGTAGDAWSMVLTLRLPDDAAEMVLIPYLSLPKGGWSLEDPTSSREGEFLVLDPIRFEGGERRILELRIRSPTNLSSGEKASIYLFPAGLEMEDES